MKNYVISMIINDFPPTSINSAQARMGLICFLKLFIWKILNRQETRRHLLYVFLLIIVPSPAPSAVAGAQWASDKWCSTGSLLGAIISLVSVRRQGRESELDPGPALKGLTVQWQGRLHLAMTRGGSDGGTPTLVIPVIKPRTFA